jgi:hypothetical protein
MEPIYAVFLVARQINGEYVFIKFEKAFKTPNQAGEYLQNLKAQYTKNGQNVPVKIMTPNGEVDCMCEVGIFDINVEQ